VIFAYFLPYFIAILETMLTVRNVGCFAALLLLSVFAYGQSAVSNSGTFTMVVITDGQQPAAGATVKLLKGNKPLKTVIADNQGAALFEQIAPGDYLFAVTYTGYTPRASRVYHFPANVHADTLKLQPLNTALQEVSVVAHVPLVQQKNGKTILNVEASVTNVGSTVLEVLEKSPGVNVDRNGGISLQGKAGVLVMIDDKQTYLSGADLNNLLSSMNASQVAQIELITNPTAKYDASGNAGIIDIKTKKNKQKGFNGSFTTSVGQGVYPKNSNSLTLNFRTGKINTFFNYNMNLVQYLTNIYALRKYYDANNEVTAKLDQPSYFSGTSFNNTIKTGLDYYVSPKTTIGFALGGALVNRNGNNRAVATWLSPADVVDSAISTTTGLKTDR
jgi:iron complex outermembrane receptor protein